MGNNCIGLYEKAMPQGFTIEQKLIAVKQCGFDYMEISIDETDEKLARLFSDEAVLSIQNACRKTGIPIRSMCLSGHRKYPLGEENYRGMEIMTAAVDFAEKIGLRIIQLAGYDTYYGKSDNKTRERFIKNLEKSVSYAAKKGVILGFETMETDFMNTCEKAMRYVTLINSPYLQVYPDIGNIRNATEDYSGDLAYARGHIVAAHLKETDEGIFRNMEYGQGRVDFKQCIEILQNSGVHMFTCEFWYDGKTDPYEYILRNKRYIDRFFKG